MTTDTERGWTRTRIAGPPGRESNRDSTSHIPINARGQPRAQRKDAVPTMTTNATPTPRPTTTTSADDGPAAQTTPPTTTGEWLRGDHYDDTAELPMSRIAETVHMDLYDVRNDNMLPTIADFEVSLDDGPIPVLRIGIAGLIGDPDGFADRSAVYDVMRSVFGLANHYNRVNLTRPTDARFMQYITALNTDGEPDVVLIGIMHDDVTA